MTRASVPIAFEPRRSRAGGVSSWTGHQPFAYLLVRELRPASIVELGTHLGESYFTFCQAVEEGGFPCRAAAVDTWEGDAHAGRYGDEIFREVEAYNESHYARFSVLLRMSFDAALAEVDDASVDLLHIDGLHTYEAARHDFESWLPKLRPGAFVLFHDIAERRGDFGVWRLWEELVPKHPHVAFDHSHGLGALRLPGGAELPEGPLRALFGPEASETRERLLAELGALGRHIDDQSEIERLGRRLEKARQRGHRMAALGALAGLALAALAALALAWRG